MSKWWEIQVLKADGTVFLIEEYRFEDVKNGLCPDWDPAKDVCVWHIKFKEEDLGYINGEEKSVIANYPYEELRGDNFENLKHVFEKHVIKSILWG